MKIIIYDSGDKIKELEINANKTKLIEFEASLFWDTISYGVWADGKIIYDSDKKLEKGE